MAYIKIFPIKSKVNQAVKYITNPDKTDSQNLVSSFSCTPETAYLEFACTEEMGKKNNMEKGNNLAWHMIISFKPGEIKDPSLAREVCTKIADATLKGKYEYVLSVHTDRAHMHCHLVFNATSFIDYHKYHSNKKSYRRICNISNKICREYGLSESMPTGERARSYKENMEYKRGNSWKSQLRYTVDRSIWTSVNYDEFLMKMKTAGYEIRQGKHLAFKHPDQKYFINVKTLGNYYTEENILNRLEKNKHKTKVPRNISREVHLFSEMTAYISTNNRNGFNRWAQLHDLKEAAKTFNYLSEHNLLNYEDFKQHYSDIENAREASKDAIKNKNHEIEHQQLIEKKCNSYRICRDIIAAEKDSPDKTKYQQLHASEYKLHDILLQELTTLGITRLPSSSKLAKQMNTLKNEQTILHEEHTKLNQQSQILSIIKTNFEAMLKDSITISNKNLESAPVKSSSDISYQIH